MIMMINEIVKRQKTEPSGVDVRVGGLAKPISVRASVWPPL